MTRDRLVEYRQKAKMSNGDYDDNGGNGNTTASASNTSSNIDVVIVEIDDANWNKELSTIYFQVLALNELINTFRDEVEGLKQLHSRIFSTPNPCGSDEDKLKDIVSSINTSARRIQAKLKDLEKSDHAPGEDNLYSALMMMRIKSTQHAACLGYFLEVMEDYQFAQVAHSERWKSRIKLQMEMACIEFSEEEFEQASDQGNLSLYSAGVFCRGIEQLQLDVVEVDDRMNEFLKLEKSVQDVHELTFEVALLVESQKATVNRINHHISQAVEYVEKAVVQLEETEDLQISIRKKKMWAAIVLIVDSVTYFRLGSFLPSFITFLPQFLLRRLKFRS